MDKSPLTPVHEEDTWNSTIQLKNLVENRITQHHKMLLNVIKFYCDIRFAIAYFRT